MYFTKPNLILGFHGCEKKDQERFFNTVQIPSCFLIFLLSHYSFTFNNKLNLNEVAPISLHIPVPRVALTQGYYHFTHFGVIASISGVTNSDMFLCTKRDNSKMITIFEIMSRNKKPGFITSIRSGRGITGTTLQRYKIKWMKKVGRSPRGRKK